MEIKDFVFSYKKSERLFNHLDLSFDENKINVLIGPNGIGKSTLLDCIADVDNLRGGITFKGFPKRSDIAYQLQGVPFIGEVSVKKTINMLMNIDGVVNNDIAIPPFIENIYEKKMGELSGGQRRLVVIFGISILQRELYLFDEPESGLDPDISEQAMMLIRKIKANGKNVIMTTHQFENLDDILYKVFFLYDGRCIFSGSMTELGEFSNHSSYADMFRQGQLQI